MSDTRTTKTTEPMPTASDTRERYWFQNEPVRSASTMSNGRTTTPASAYRSPVDVIAAAADIMADLRDRRGVLDDVDEDIQDQIEDRIASIIASHITEKDIDMSDHPTTETTVIARAQCLTGSATRSDRARPAVQRGR